MFYQRNQGIIILIKRVMCLVFLLLLPLSTLLSQDSIKYNILFYNVENLFDIQHDSLKNDYDYLPEGIRHWNKNKYYDKINKIGKVILTASQWTPPSLIGLCEVENEQVIEDIVHQSPLKNLDYHYFITNSPDKRGIDVALLYQRGDFKPIFQRSIRINDFLTRDILHVSGLLINKDTLDIFVVHLPSRRNGKKASEPRRLKVAELLKYNIDSLMHRRLMPQIIVMGDFNDYPENKSIKTVLKAIPIPSNPKEIIPHHLYHLLANQVKRLKNGSYKHKGEWGLLDHIIISGNLLSRNASFHTDESKAIIVEIPELLTIDKKYGGKTPFRTYYGMKYMRGFSDHLPVMATFTLTY